MGEAQVYQRWLRGLGIQWDKAYRAVHLPGWADEYQPGISAEYDQTTWCANEAIKFITEKRDRPWLLNVNPFDPHPLSFAKIPSS